MEEILALDFSCFKSEYVILGREEDDVDVDDGDDDGDDDEMAMTRKWR